MTTQTIVTMFISYGGLRLVEGGLKFLITDAKKVIGAKKYDKMVDMSKVAVKDVIKTLNDTGATAALDNIKDAALKKVAERTGLDYKELDEFVDIAIKEIEHSIIDAAKEEENISANSAIKSSPSPDSEVKATDI